MRRLFLPVLFLFQVGISTAFATEYSSIAVPYDDPSPYLIWPGTLPGVPWPVGISRNQTDFVKATNQAVAECSRQSGRLGCKSIVFESGQCGVLTIGNHQASSLAYLSVSNGTAKQAIADNQRICSAQNNETCNPIVILCESYTSFLDQVQSSVTTFFDEADPSTYLPIAATIALLLFIGSQLYSFIRHRRHLARHVIRNCLLSIAAGVVGTYAFLFGQYVTPGVVAFIIALTTANKVLLGAITMAVVLFAFPIHFWDAARRVLTFNRPTERAASASAAPSDPGSQNQSGSPDPTAPESSSPPPPGPEPVVSQDLPPGQPMALKLKRTQKQGLTGPIYMLDARIDVSAEVRALIIKHNLSSRVIYESSDRQKHAANAEAHLAGSHSGAGFFAPPKDQAMGAAKTLWKLVRAGVSAARASFSLRVTVNSLLSGVHVECKSMDELLEAEDAFREAKANLEVHIASAQTFDGREEVV
jgi:hypothetical protein